MTDKWGRRLFKTGAAFLLLLGFVHSFSFINPLTPANDTERQLLELMTSYKFNLMGSARSMSDLMTGFSVSFMLAAVGFGALDLALASERTGLLKRLALINSLWLAAMIAVSLHYFFAVPTSFLALALAIFVTAWFRLPSDNAN